MNSFHYDCQQFPEAEIGGKSCLDIGVYLNTDCTEDEKDVEASPKELLNLIVKHERRS